MSLRVTIRKILKKNVMTYKLYFMDVARGRVRDSSVKPTARVGFAGRQGEDLQRIARPQATPIS
ncbi:hypothetical protein SNE26_15960 [Mucilaginibacter sp. cycad4]|uniref:hypothetical protein n=1 Tax=Mucilaginibacter sp. cycad4 TaxID=3342096 RepID=UPI002AAA653D|nr:hypothetical protein [Mucilaginibacter gossypii]WPU97522.1 hypothetical protein SNE26_15960 [Mucilaginibacter gossypii]